MGALAQQAFQKCVERVVGRFGQLVTFRGNPITADVNYSALGEGPLAQGEAQFGVTGRTVITFLSASVATAPARGEIIQDSESRYHRIESVDYTGHAYECVCQPSEEP